MRNIWIWFKRNIGPCLLLVLYLLLFVFQTYFFRDPSKSAINGIFMCTELMVLTFMMILSKGTWLWVCLFNSLLQVGLVTKAILSGNKAASPGVVIAISVVIYQVLLALYIRGQVKAQLKLREVAVTDKLTGLLNRYGFEEKLQSLIEIGKAFALFFIDLDNFKYVNDTLGHEAGDLVLQKVSEYWTSCLDSDNQTLVRIGGDEFALIVDSDKPLFIENKKKDLLSISTLEDPLLKNISTSVGIVTYPKDAKDKKTLLAYADSAMYKAKSSGKNNAQYFNKVIHDEIVKEYETKLIISDAIKDKQFKMFYQPQYSSNEEVYGFESLIRLKIGDNYLSTQYFIDVAEKNNLIFDIDRFVLDQVTKDWSSTVNSSLGKDLVISVNVSGKHLINPGFLEEVLTTLTKNNFPPQNLCIEITEGAFVKSLLLAKSVVDQLRLIGVKIALDDFGTKYSSLRYLQDFSTNHLKIEKSFTDTIKIDTSDNNIVNIIINIAHLLRCEVIAEGVETEDQLKYLRDHGCDIIQGYYYSKPLTLEDAFKKL